MTNSENNKNVIISYIYLAFSILSSLLGFYGLYFIKRINEFSAVFNIERMTIREVHLFTAIFIILISINFILIIASINMLKKRKWANMIIEIYNWICFVIMIVFSIIYVYFIFNIDKIYNIQNKRIIVFKTVGLFITIIYIIIVFLLYYINKQLRLLRDGYEKE